MTTAGLEPATWSRAAGSSAPSVSERHENRSSVSEAARGHQARGDDDGGSGGTPGFKKKNTAERSEGCGSSGAGESSDSEG